MAWEGVPWFVDGGEHGPEVARVLAYAAMGGREGVIGPSDCKVTASAIPDGNIHIQPGAFGALNRFSGADSQGYIGRNIGDEVKALTPQGAGGERWDLIAAIVQDPQYAGQPDPPSVPDGPYVITAVYEDVPETTRTLAEVDSDQSGIALALVHFSASDATVTNSDITDLRQLLFSRSQTVTKMVSITSTTPDNMSTSGLQVFPPGASWDVEVPLWANKVQLSAVVSGIDALDSGADGGTAVGTAVVDLDAITTDTATWRVNATGPGKRTTYTFQAAEDNLDCSSIAGQTATLRCRAVKSGGSGMTVRSIDGTTAVVTATFMEKVV